MWNILSSQNGDVFFKKVIKLLYLIIFISDTQEYIYI